MKKDFDKAVLTDKDRMFEFMLDTKTKEEWDQNCQDIKNANGGEYPEIFRTEVVNSGLMALKTAELKMF